MSNSGEHVNRVKVIIHGMEYTLRGPAPQAQMREVAQIVDRKMTEIAAMASYMDERRVAVLTALNLADELFQLRKEYQDLMSLLDAQTRSDEPT